MRQGSGKVRHHTRNTTATVSHRQAGLCKRAVHHRWFYGRPDQVTVVRAFVVDRPVVDDAVLLTSELATKAVQHTPSNLPGAGFGVLIEHEHGHSVRVTVQDGGSYFDAPYVAQPEPDAEHGTGAVAVSVCCSCEVPANC